MTDLFAGELVRLGALDKEELQASSHWMRDYDLRRWMEDETIVPMTDEAQQAWIDKTLVAEDAYYFAIVTLAEERFIGTCGLFSIDDKNGSAEFGIGIGEKDYWGRGYGTDAARLVLRFAFMERNLHRIELATFDFNERAIRSYEKVGFVHEGTRRQAIFREGEYHDVHIMAALRSDWEAASATE
jgi:RimJ/RimL family protein N-acetyltransferase